MNISELISTPERERILRVLLYSPEKKTLHQIARDAGVSPPQAHKYLSILKKNNLVAKSVLMDGPLIRSLRLAENIISLKNANVTGIILSHVPGATSIGLYGSWGRGVNDEKSDIDLWVLAKNKADDLALGKLRRDLENKLERKVDLILLTDNAVHELKDKNPTFYYSIYNSVKLWGADVW